MTSTPKTIILILTFSITSCATVVQSIFGIKEANKLSDKQIVKASKSVKADQNSNYRLDTTYLTYILNLDTSIFRLERKNHLQPLQALYFDSQGKLVKFYINCYAGGFPNLNWNRNENLETFLPKDQAPIDTILNLKKQLSFLRPVCLTTNETITENQDYYVFIYWDKCTKRHSKRLIKSIKQNVSKSASKKVKTIYVNYDNVLNKLENK